MADETRIIQVNTGTTAQWNNQVRPLAVGEFGYNNDTKELKIGDGTTSFANLKAFLTGDNAISQIQAIINAANGIAGLDGNAKVPEANLPVKFFIGEYYYLQVIREGFVWANGGLLENVSTEYPMLKAWLLDTGTYGGAQFRKTQTQWDAEHDDSKWNAPDTSGTREGMSPFYVYDAAADTIRVPDLRGAHQEAAGFDGQPAGRTLVDAIRDIAGTIQEHFGGHMNQTGAFESIGTITGITGGSTTNTRSYGSRVKASRVVPTALVNRPRSYTSYLCLYAGAPA